MNCSRKISVRRDVNLGGAGPNHRHRTEAAVPALNEFIVVRCLHWLAIAGVFLLLAPRTFASAEITGGSGTFEASADLCVDLPDCNMFPPDCNEAADESIAAPIGNPQDSPAGSISLPQCSGNGFSAGPVDAHGAYTGDAQSMTLTASASGSTTSSNSAQAFVGADNTTNIHFTVTGEPTDVPISVSLVAFNCIDASATLTGPNGFFAEITADNSGQHGSFPSDPLEPGEYTIALSFSADNPNPQSSFNFNFSATIVVHTTAPIEWVNPVDGSFQTAENWDPQKVPSGTDDAIFDVPGTYTVSLDGSASHNALFGSGTGVNVTFLLGGNTYTLNQLQTGGLAGENASFTFSGVFDPSIIDSGPTGFAAQGAGGLVQVNQPLIVGDGAAQAYVEQTRVSANQVSVEGLLRVKDPGSLLETDSLQVGIFGNDPEFFVDEGQVVSTHATVGSSAFVRVGRGTVLQTPDPSHWEIADELDVTDDASVDFIGGSVNVGGRCVIGDDSTAFSELFVSGILGGPAVGATFSVSELIVGRNGKGTMTVAEFGAGSNRFPRHRERPGQF